MTAPVARAGADLRLLRAAVFAAVCVVLSGIGHVVASCAGLPLWTLGAGFAAVLAVAATFAGRERSLPGIAAGLAAGQLALHSLFGLAQYGAPRGGTDAMRGGGANGGVSEGTLISLAAKLVCNDGPGRLTPGEARRILSDAGISPGGGPGAAGSAADSMGGTGAGAGSGTMGHAGHTAADHLTAGVSAARPSLLTALVPSLPMLLAHLLAALALGLLLRRGEAALFRLARLSARGVAEGSLVRSLCAALALVRALRAGLPGAPAAPVRAPRAYDTGEAGPSAPVLEHSVSRRGPPRYALAA